MIVTMNELKKAIDKYLRLAESEDVFVVENGKTICKLTNAFEDKISLVESLVGVVPSNPSIEEGKEERLRRHEAIN